MSPLELVAVGLFLVAAWGHGFLTGIPYGAIQPGDEEDTDWTPDDGAGYIPTEERRSDP